MSIFGACDVMSSMLPRVDSHRSRVPGLIAHLGSLSWGDECPSWDPRPRTDVQGACDTMSSMHPRVNSHRSRVLGPIAHLRSLSQGDECPSWDPRPGADDAHLRSLRHNVVIASQGQLPIFGACPRVMNAHFWISSNRMSPGNWPNRKSPDVEWCDCLLSNWMSPGN